MATDSMEILCSYGHNDGHELVFEHWSVVVVGTESGIKFVDVDGYAQAAEYVRDWIPLEGPFPVEYTSFDYAVTGGGPRHPVVPPKALTFTTLR